MRIRRRTLLSCLTVWMTSALRWNILLTGVSPTCTAEMNGLGVHCATLSQLTGLKPGPPSLYGGDLQFQVRHLPHGKHIPSPPQHTQVFHVFVGTFQSITLQFQTFLLISTITGIHLNIAAFTLNIYMLIRLSVHQFKK